MTRDSFGNRRKKTTELKTEEKSDGKFDGICNICGMRGHKAKYCWEKKENAHLR